ncbi:MAG: hypothetical protein LBC61_02870, partial [Candidatus Peribacteria bacterium]|nr:hypothetical protein [Candidatus Peribacteria bacterium]
KFLSPEVLPSSQSSCQFKEISLPHIFNCAIFIIYKIKCYSTIKLYYVFLLLSRKIIFKSKNSSNEPKNLKI